MVNLMSEDDDDEQIESLPTPAPPDRFGDALALCRIANNKTVATQLKKLRRVNRQIADAEAKIVAVQDQAEQMQAALAARAAAIDARERAITQREDEFAASLQEARDHLRAHYDRIADMDRRIRYRIMASAGLLHGFNEKLQDLPSWDTIGRMVPGLPADLPATPPAVAAPLRIDAFADVCSDPGADRHGAPFLGELTRSTEHKRGAA
jgi:hypothetical protein